MKWLISRAGGDGGRRRGGRGAPSITDSLLHPHFSACPPSFWSAEEVLRWLNSQSVTNSIRPTLQSGNVSSLMSCQPTTEDFCQWLWLLLNLSASRWRHYAEVIKQSPWRCEQRKRGRSLLCCPSWGSWCPSSRSRTLSRMHALWWDYWRRSTSHSLRVEVQKRIHTIVWNVIKAQKVAKSWSLKWFKFHSSNVLHNYVCN